MALLVLLARTAPAGIVAADPVLVVLDDGLLLLEPAVSGLLLDRLLGGGVRLLDAVPAGVDDARVYRQRSGEMVLPRSKDFYEAYKEKRELFNAQPVKAYAAV